VAALVTRVTVSLSVLGSWLFPLISLPGRTTWAKRLTTALRASTPRAARI